MSIKSKFLRIELDFDLYRQTSAYRSGRFEENKIFIRLGTGGGLPCPSVCQSPVCGHDFAHASSKKWVYCFLVFFKFTICT